MKLLHNRFQRILFVVLLSFLLLPQSAHAEQASTTKQITIVEKQYNVQIVIVGDAEKSFEADLELPDGTKIDHKNYDGNKMLYLETEAAERRWLLNVASPGTYKLHISGEQQNYMVNIKEELVKPSTTWLSPLNTTVNVSNDLLSLSWRVEGDYDDNDRIRFYLTATTAGVTMHIGEQQLSVGEVQLSLPATIADGKYKLTAIADNKTNEGQQLDPKVTINMKRGHAAPIIEIKELIPEGDIVSFELEAPRNWGFYSVQAQLSDEAGTSIRKEGFYDDLLTIEEDVESDKVTYLWTVSLPEGSYKGTLQLLYDNGTATPSVAIDSFVMKQRDWSKDKVEWIPEAEKINSSYVQLKLTLLEETHVLVVDSVEGVRYEHLLTPDGEQQIDETITIPLIEGDHILEVFLRDKYGAATSYSKRYLVDRTPPTLTMIQPQSKHSKLTGGMASGFTDTDSVVIVDGKEIQLDAAGYFQIIGVKNELALTVRDAHGNETYFNWQKASSTKRTMIIFIVVNALLIAATIAIIWWLRRTSMKKST